VNAAVAVTFRENLTMKSLLVAVVAVAGMTIVGTAAAQEDLAKKYCGSCHAVDTKKMGPAFKDVAKKYKGNAGAEAELVGKITSHKGHPAVKASEAEVASVVKWVLAM
jgi:cytochrome c